MDLHLHSTASDGSLSPSQLVTRAKKCGLRTIALTDHDTMAGVDEAVSKGIEIGLRVIPGIELNADDNGCKMHILGYFVDHTNPELNRVLTNIRENRSQRIFHTLDKLISMGINIDKGLLKPETEDGVIGRSDLARVIVSHGYANTKKEAYDRFIGEGAPAFVPRPKLTPEEAIKYIIYAGGVPVLAHPDLGYAEPRLGKLKSFGLQGIEVYHYSHDIIKEKQLCRLAERFDLAVTGGSDWHGEGGKIRGDLGDLKVSEHLIDRLQALHQSNRFKKTVGERARYAIGGKNARSAGRHFHGNG